MSQDDGMAESDEIDSETRASTDFVLVGVGASAGGLGALKAFFSAVPADSGMAYVVIVHLDPDHESQMAPLLQAVSSIPITQIGATFTPEINHAYVIPPNKNLSAVGTIVKLAKRDRSAPIDLFFRTLAEVYGAGAVGVVLTGTGSDGTAGIERIREAGGITIAQDPAEAEYRGMPESAIATGHVDLVLPVAQMPSRLVDLHLTTPRLPRTDRPVREPPGPRDDIAKVMSLLLRHTAHDFSGYKRSTFLRRLERRMRVRGTDVVPDYIKILRTDRAEADLLFRDLLISVSSFFRDPGAWAVLEQEVIPKLFSGRGPEEQLRAWVVGCARGEEAYTLAILLREHADVIASARDVQVFATDIDDRALKSAREGLFPESIAADVTSARLNRFFGRQNHRYRVAETLRDSVLFALHSVLRDPPFSRLDLVTCRNVLIYLTPEAQQTVLRTFHYSLRPGGHLFLGTSEFPGDNGLFAPVDPDKRIYVRMETSRRVLPRPTVVPLSEDGRNPVRAIAGSYDLEPQFSYGPLHVRMLEAYAPPSLVVDGRGRVVHLSPSAGRYLQLPGGPPSANLLEMVSADVRLELRTALHEVLTEASVTRRRVQMEIAGQRTSVELHVSPPPAGEHGKYALIVFDREEVEAETSEESVVDGAEVGGRDQPPRASSDLLEGELSRTRERLAASLEQRDVTIEQLRSTNEELQSINEQHKTALEEMETSHEELQSLNEEFTTINQERQATIEELRHTTADLTNLIEVIDVATVFLDRNLAVRRLSPSVAEVFNVTPGDLGRPIGHFTHRLEYDRLVDDAKRVLTTLLPVEREVRSDEGEWYSVRMRPYLLDHDRVDGVVVTLYEITESKRQEASEHEARQRAEAEEGRLRALMQQLPVGVLVIDARTRTLTSANGWAAKLLGGGSGVSAFVSGVGVGVGVGVGYTPVRRTGEPYAPESWPVTRLMTDGMVLADEEIECRFEDGRTAVFLVSGTRIEVSAGSHEVREAIVTIVDITGRKEMEAELRRSRGEAEAANRAKGIFMATLSHEFRTPLHGIVGYAGLLAQDPRLDAEQKRKLNRIQAAVEHLNGMIDEILGLSELDGTRTAHEVVRSATLDARAAVRAAVEMCEPLAALAGLPLRLDMPDVPVQVTTDHGRLRMIVVNLLGNAIKFTKVGEIQIWLRERDGRMLLAVQDTGIGIDAQHHELIFERFWQVSKGLTRDAAGVGIGLSAAREFSRKLGGDLAVRSDLGHGSVFTLWLPTNGATGAKIESDSASE